VFSRFKKKRCRLFFFFFTNKKSKSMKFDRNKDGGEDEEDRVPAAEAARR
jgi:hypothetical protein